MSAKYGLAVLFFLCLACAPLAAQEPVSVSVRSLNSHLAVQMAMAALKSCTAKGYKTAVAVVDRGGNLLAFVRDPLAGPHTIDVSYQKAYAAASFQTATLEMRDLSMLSHAPRVLVAGGGLPISIAGEFYGGLAVAGAPPRKVQGDIDAECAQAGIDAITETLEFAQ